MSLGITQQSKGVPGGAYEWQYVFAGDASYPAGGYILTPASFQALGGPSRIAKIFAPDVWAFANGITSAIATPTYSTGLAANIITQIALRLFVGPTEVTTGATCVGTTVALLIHGS